MIERSAFRVGLRRPNQTAQLFIMFDKSLIGFRFEPFTLEVEKGPMRLFAKAIGETDPVYHDEPAAKTAGHRSILAPPTYVFCLESIGGTDDELVGLLAVGDAAFLHGEQAFEYFDSVYAGDQLTFSRTVVDIYDKKGGQLEFVVTESEVMNQHGVRVARMRSTGVINRAQS